MVTAREQHSDEYGSLISVPAAFLLNKLILQSVYLRKNVHNLILSLLPLLFFSLPDPLPVVYTLSL